MSLADHTAPIDPIKFRDDILELLEQAEDFCHDPGFRFWEFASIRLVCKYVRSKHDCLSQNQVDPIDEDPDFQYCTSAALRLSEFMKVIKGQNIQGLVRRSIAGQKDVHLSLLEAAAVIPFAEKGAFRENLILEARRRKIEIDVLSNLLGEV